MTKTAEYTIRLEKREKGDERIKADRIELTLIKPEEPDDICRIHEIMNDLKEGWRIISLRIDDAGENVLDSIEELKERINEVTQ